MKKKPKITPENKAILEAPENKGAALSPWEQRLVGAEAKKPPAQKRKIALSPWDTSRATPPNKKKPAKGAKAKKAPKKR